MFCSASKGRKFSVMASGHLPVKCHLLQCTKQGILMESQFACSLLKHTRVCRFLRILYHDKVVDASSLMLIWQNCMPLLLCSGIHLHVTWLCNHSLQQDRLLPQTFVHVQQSTLRLKWIAYKVAAKAALWSR